MTKTVAIIGGGPSGLVTAKELAAAGLHPTVLERGDDIGGQWNVGTASSSVWTGMRTNTSKDLTAFSDFPPPAEYPTFPTAEQVHDYLHAYAEHFGVLVRTGAEVSAVRPSAGGWTVEWCERGQLRRAAFDHVVIASGRFTAPAMPRIAGIETFHGRVLHSADFRSRDEFRGQRVLVYGNSISGLEIAAEIAADSSTEVLSACRKPRYIIPKIARGVPADWQWFTRFAAVAGRALPPEALGAALRAEVLATAGNPADFGGLDPTEDILGAGLSQSQHYLPMVAEGRISPVGAVRAVHGSVVEFVDGTTSEVDVIVCATGFDLHLPYLDPALVPGELFECTFHPERTDLGFVGQYVLVGPYFPVVELQARWLARVWSGAAELSVEPSPERPPGPELHHDLATRLAARLGVTPDLDASPDLAAALLFGPMLPATHRLSGPGSLPDAADAVRASVRLDPVDPGRIEALRMIAGVLGDDALARAADQLAGASV